MAGPVPLAQPFGNDDVEAAAERLGGREAEDPLRAGIPEPDDPFGVGDDDGVGQLAELDIAESIEVHASVSPPPSAPPPWRSSYSFSATALLCGVSRAACSSVTGPSPLRPINLGRAPGQGGW